MQCFIRDKYSPALTFRIHDHVLRCLPHFRESRTAVVYPPHPHAMRPQDLGAAFVASGCWNAESLSWTWYPHCSTPLRPHACMTILERTARCDRSLSLSHGAAVGRDPSWKGMTCTSVQYSHQSKSSTYSNHTGWYLFIKVLSFEMQCSAEHLPSSYFSIHVACALATDTLDMPLTVPVRRDCFDGVPGSFPRGA